MQTTSSFKTKKVGQMSWRDRDARRRLLLAMAKDAEKLQEQVERLVDLKKHARVTYHDISVAVHVTERQVQRWFSGESDVGDESLLKLADYLGTTPDYIEYGVIQRQRGDTPEPLPAPPVNELLAEVKSLTRAVEELLRRAPQTGQPS